MGVKANGQKNWPTRVDGITRVQPGIVRTARRTAAFAEEAWVGVDGVARNHRRQRNGLHSHLIHESA